VDGILKDGEPVTVMTGDGSFEFTPQTGRGLAYIKLQNSLAAKGEKPRTVDEVLKAVELARAGCDGTGELWRE